MPVPAAHTAMYGTFSLLMTGTVAKATGESMPPNRATTFAFAISSRAATTPLGGTDSSSRWINSILRPPRSPPLALISSMARLRPRVMASPDWAEPPESAATWPILMGSSADEDVGAAPTTASVALAPNPIATASLRHCEYAFFIATPNVSSSTRQQPQAWDATAHCLPWGPNPALLPALSLRPNRWICDWAAMPSC